MSARIQAPLPTPLLDEDNLIAHISYLGKYRVEIENALCEAGIENPSDKDVRQGLYYCRDYADSGVGYERTCNKCNDGGDGGQSDYCDSVGPVSTSIS